MSFDARSRERLEALGRRLPEKLPLPAAPRAGSGTTGSTPVPSASAGPTATQADAPARGGGSSPRHRLETEENPEALFRALMQASADGSVPSHLLERLRELEQSRPAATRPPAPPDGLSASLTAPPGSGAGRGGGSTGAPKRSPRRREGNRSSRRPADAAEGALYDAFDDLLGLEDDDAPPLPPRVGRPSDDRLQPRPTLRRQPPGD